MASNSTRSCFVAGAAGDPTTQEVISRAGAAGLDVATAVDTPSLVSRIDTVSDNSFARLT